MRRFIVIFPWLLVALPFAFATDMSASAPSGVRSVSASAPLASTGGRTPTLSLQTSGVVAGAYTNANVTVDAYGRVTTAASGSSGGDLGLDLATFGSGSDGDVTITGSVTLVRPMQYRNLTISGAGALNADGYPIAVSLVLDVSAAGAGAIRADSSNGDPGSAGIGGSSTTPSAVAWLPYCTSGSNGASAGTGAGAQANTVTVANGQFGGRAGGGGSGGNGAASGAAASTTSNMTTNAVTPTYLHPFAAPWLRIATALLDGNGGRGGSSGGGDSVSNNGGGGGAGGTGGRVLLVYARTINRSGSTAVGAFRALGGNGGLGATPGVGANNGGGGGGGGGSGGAVILAYRALTGSTATNALDASGGNGGNGGNGRGSGTAGGGGQGGTGGILVLHNLTTGAATVVDNRSNSPSSATGQTGGTGVVTRSNL